MTNGLIFHLGVCSIRVFHYISVTCEECIGNDLLLLAFCARIVVFYGAPFESKYHA